MFVCFTRFNLAEVERAQFVHYFSDFGVAEGRAELEDGSYVLDWKRRVLWFLLWSCLFTLLLLLFWHFFGYCTHVFTHFLTELLVESLAELKHFLHLV